ncbi:type I DNA topoisomerase [Desulforudis sp. 1088]|uniref:type I DNA topoisomerase n=1 Tax=unclassified Candidatus Desulforudis TaxID=2635950 RepID=UPI00348A65C1
MSKTLVIVESPAKAKTLTKFLGRKYQVLASMGHVRDLPKSQFGVNVEKGFLPKYITIRGKGDTISELRNAARKADKVLLASDPDREGEAIAWHLQQLLKIDDDAPCRIEFNEITKKAVVDALKHPRRIDQNRVNAQQARRILDRLVGYNLSPLLWRKVRRGLSAGRVQSVALYLICEREDEIDAFVPEEYWTLAVILTKDGDKIEAKLFKRNGEKVTVRSKEEMDRIMSELEGAAYRVVEVKRKERVKNPPPPFTTSTLQQEANRKLNFTTRRTMMVAQQLYEGLDIGKDGHTGLVTYIRTDSVRVSSEAREEAARFVAEHFGPEYLPKQHHFYGSKGKVQDAHEAIRPTSVARHPDLIKNFLTSDQYKLYALIWSRFVASQMAPAVIDTTRVDIAAGRYLFRATGAIVKFPGYTRVYADEHPEEDEGRILPPLQEDDVLKVTRRVPKQHFTQPPPRYTEAMLVRALEEKGIGRPSTYAPVVETIQKRGYVVRRGKNLFPTELGRKVLDLLKEYFPDVINVEFTAEMEEKLDQIEDGDIDWVAVLDAFYASFRDDVAKAEQEIGKIPLEEEQEEVTDEICEFCGRNMVVKTGRYGRFLACPGFPECKNARPILEETGQACPKCGAKVVVRRTRKGRTFFGCSAYPKCDFVTWDTPVNEKCPQCGTFLVQKQTKKNKTYYCANPECTFRDKQQAAGGQKQ